MSAALTEANQELNDLLRQALPAEHLPSDLVAPHEIAGGLRMLFASLALLTPQDPLWPALTSRADAVESATQAQRLRDGSRHDPLHQNALWGHTGEYPVCAALATAQRPEHRWVAGILLALALAPLIVPRLTAAKTPDASQTPVDPHQPRLGHASLKVLGLLKHPLDSTLADRLEHDLKAHLNWSDSGPQVFLEQPLPPPSGQGAWADLYRHINHLIRNLPRPRKGSSDTRNAQADREHLQTVYDNHEQTTADDLGLAPEDRGEHSFVIEIHDLPPRDDKACVQRIHSAFGLLSCAPPLAWNVLPPEQGRVLAQAIRADIEAQSSLGGSVLATLSMITTLPVEVLMDVPIAPSLFTLLTGDSPRQALLAWQDGHLFACLPSRTPAHAFKRLPGAAGLQPHLACVVVGIPPLLAAQIGSRLPGGAGTLRTAFPDANAQLRQFLPMLRDRLNIEVTATRVRQSIAWEVLKQTQSMWTAATLQPDSAIPELVLDHYAASPLENLYDQHRAACASLLGEDMAPPPLEEPIRSLLSAWAGSELAPDLKEWSQRLREQFRRVQALIDQPTASIEDAAHCANAVNRLVTHCLRLGTGARPHEGLFNLGQDLSLELGLAQLAEKQSNQRDTTRPSLLPLVLCELERTRRRMVRWTADVMAQEDEQLAGQLLSTLGGHKDYPSAPVLFILKKRKGRWHALPMNGEQEYALWDPPLPWARNANRAALVQYLLGQGAREEAIRALLGHSDFVGTLADPNCPHAPAALFSELETHLSGFLAEVGVGKLEWPEDKKPTSGKSIALVVSPTPLFGDFDPTRIARRAQTRVRHQRIYSAFREVGLSRLPGDLILTRLMAIVAEKFPDDPAQRQLALRVVERKFGKLPTKRLENIFRSEAAVRKRLLVLIEHPTPYDREELQSIAMGEKLRNAALGKALTDWQVALRAGPASAQAYLLLTAMAAGALLAPDAVGEFCRALPHLYVDGDTAWIEYSHNGECWRWVADDLSAALLVSYHAEFGHRPPVSSTQLLGALDQLLQDVAGDTLPPGMSPKSRIRWAQSQLLAWFRHHVPGTLLSHADASRPSAPLPRSVLARRQGHYVVSRHGDMRKRGDSIKVPNLPTKKQLDAALVQLCASVGLPEGRLKAKQVEQLREEVSKLSGDGKKVGALSVAGEVFIRFLYCLRTRGGRIKPLLADTTISAYLTPVRALLRQLPGDEILDLSGDEREMAYREAYLAGSESGRSRRLLALQMFDEVLQETYGTEAVTWSVVTAGAGAGAARIDANVVWPHERARAAALLQRGPAETAAEREAAELLMHLMAATGARFSEAFHLRLCDIQHDERYVLIRPSRENKRLKTHAAKRRVPLAERLTPRGLDLLRKALARAQARNPGQRETPLFADPASPGHMMDRARLQSLLAQALRLATGDASLRPHHLRHTWACETYELWVAPLERGSDAARDARRMLFGTELPTRRAVAQWALALGHADMETGHRVYLHNQEFRVARATSRLLPRLGRKELARLLGLAASSRAPTSPKAAVRLASKAGSQLAPWRGLEIGKPPSAVPGQDLTPTIPRWPAISHLHVILTHPAKGRLSPVDFAALFGLPPAMMSALLDAESEIYSSNLYFRGTLPAGLTTPAPSQFRTLQLAKDLPAGFAGLTGRVVREEPPVTPENVEGARAALALWHGRRRRSDRSQTEISLIEALRWHLALGFEPRNLTVQVPSVAWKRWLGTHGSLKGLKVSIHAKRPRLRIVATGREGLPAGHAVAYLSQLWLVLAKGRALHASGCNS